MSATSREFFSASTPVFHHEAKIHRTPLLPLLVKEEKNGFLWKEGENGGLWIFNEGNEVVE